MKSFLTPEEKQYLRATSRYLKSLGQSSASIEFDHEGDDLDDINWKYYDTFSSNHTTQVPTKVVGIFDRVLKMVTKEDLIEEIDSDYDINYSRVEISIDAENEDLSVQYWYSYYTDGAEQGTEWLEGDVEDDEELQKVFDTLQNDLQDVGDSDKKTLTLNYNGSGDSGYIDDYFEGGIAVPADVENWCYRALENQYGGWEINEGSRGHFTFHPQEKTVTLYHIQIDEENSSQDVWSESFKK